jgi:hemerythrin-like domain-containing protein
MDVPSSLATLVIGLRREHLRMREVLGLVAGQLDRLGRGEHPDFQLTADALSYMRSFPSQVHHPKEDAIFGRLARRAPDCGRLVGEICEQHLQIYEVETWLKGMALRRPLHGSVEAQRFISFGREYLRLQRDHAHTEDTLLFPRALEVLDQDDQDCIAGMVEETEDPLFGECPQAEFQLLYEHLLESRQAQKPESR